MSPFSRNCSTESPRRSKPVLEKDWQPQIAPQQRREMMARAILHVSDAAGPKEIRREACPAENWMKCTRCPLPKPSATTGWTTPEDINAGGERSISSCKTEGVRTCPSSSIAARTAATSAASWRRPEPRSGTRAKSADPRIRRRYFPHSRPGPSIPRAEPRVAPPVHARFRDAQPPSNCQ